MNTGSKKHKEAYRGSDAGRNYGGENKITKKQIDACENTVKMWKWLAVHPGKDKHYYFIAFQKELDKMVKADRRSRDNKCFMCGSFDCYDDCPLENCTEYSAYDFWYKTDCPVYAFLIADTVERALKAGGKGCHQNTSK